MSPSSTSSSPSVATHSLESNISRSKSNLEKSQSCFGAFGRQSLFSTSANDNIHSSKGTSKNIHKETGWSPSLIIPK
jgi:hypothetical protein